jgi:uncharacterized membrane protein YwaF
MIRQLHLYLGCVFAPLLSFFALSGLWQTLRIGRDEPGMLRYLSTIHTGQGLKSPDLATLSSPWLQGFVVLMTAAWLATMILGVVMAFRFGRRRVAASCLLAGLLIPLFLVLGAFYLG